MLGVRLLFNGLVLAAVAVGINDSTTEFNDSTTWQWLLFSTGINDSTARRFADVIVIVQGLEGLVVYHRKTRGFKPLVLLAGNWNWIVDLSAVDAESIVETLMLLISKLFTAGLSVDVLDIASGASVATVTGLGLETVAVGINDSFTAVVDSTRLIFNDVKYMVR